MPAYEKGINRVFYSRYKEKRTEHVQMEGMASKVNINIIERFHGTIKQRYRVLRGLRTDRTAQIILDGFVTHYNYFKPHITLKNKVPAEVADVEYTYENWQALLEFADRSKGTGELRENISRENLRHYV